MRYTIYKAIQPGGLINFTFRVVIWFYGIEYQNAEWSILVDGVWDFKGTGYDEGYEFMVKF